MHGAVAEWLRHQNHEVFSVCDDARGLDDSGIIQKALEEDWILITNDKDFGDLIFRDGRLHKGVILLRLDDERASSKIHVLSCLIQRYSKNLPNAFVVATEKQVRFARR